MGAVAGATCCVAIVKHVSIGGGNLVIDHKARDVVGVGQVAGVPGSRIQFHTCADHESFVIGELPEDLCAVRHDMVGYLEGSLIDHVGKPVGITQGIEIGGIGGALVEGARPKRASMAAVAFVCGLCPTTPAVAPTGRPNRP